MKSKLKVGLMVDSLELPRWIRPMVERISASDFAEIHLVVLLDFAGAAREETIGGHWVGRFYLAFERWWMGEQLDALQEIPSNDLLGRTRVIHVRPIDQEGSVRFPDEAVAALRSENLDVLFQVRPRRLGGSVLDAARYGIWTCRHGLGSEVLPGFREVLERNPVTSSRLERVIEGTDEGPILYRSFAASQHWSVIKNCNAVHWKAASFLPRVLEQLWLHGSQVLACTDPGVDANPHHPDVALSASATSRLISTSLLRRTLYAVQNRLWREQWLLLRAIAHEGIPKLEDFLEMLPPRDRFWADPHLLLREGKHYLFLEEALYQTDKGHIAVMVLDGQGCWSGPTKVLEKPYHLSNPFVFEWKGDIYMVPESASNLTVDLYRCDRFPDRWVHVRSMLTGLQAVDATLFPHGGKWWMFVNVAENPGTSTCDELFLFYTDDPVAGKWTPHPRNPIVSDVRCARPAGALFVKDGKIVRPAQDCAERYGRAVRFMRIDRLTETDYWETAIGQLRPGKGDRLLGVHTFDQMGQLMVIDAIRRRSRFW